MEDVKFDGGINPVIIHTLATAYDGESRIRNKYTAYAEIAQKEGHPEVASVFLEVADNEKEHARWFLKMLNMINEMNPNVIPQSLPNLFNYRIGDTQTNLNLAIVGETLEYTTYYPEFAKLAESVGLVEISSRVNAISIAEKHHADRFKKLLANLTPGNELSENIYNEKTWICRQCGYVAIGDNPPIKCPSCDCTDCFYQAS